MKRNLSIITALLTVLFFYSCSKEKSIDTTDPDGPGGGGGNTSGSNLSKIVYKDGSDSSILTFGYDASKRVNSIINYFTDAGDAYTFTTEMTRNSQGIIQTIVSKSDDLLQYGLDNITSIVTYDAASRQYKSKVSTITILTQTLKDSTAYEYDGTGKIARERRFIKQGPVPYAELSKTEYAYSGNNLVTIRQHVFDDQTNTYENESNQTIEYDAKTNPLIMGNEAILVGETSFFSANNILKQTIEYPDEPADNETITAAYTYNSANKPSSGTITYQGGGSGTVTYVYQ